MASSDIEMEVFNDLRETFVEKHKNSIKKSAKYEDIVEDAKLLVSLARKKLKNEDSEWWSEVATNRHVDQLSKAYDVFEKNMKELAKNHRIAEEAYDDIVEIITKHFKK